MSDAMNLQDAILNEVRRDRVPVTLFLMNGFQLRGIVTGFDSFVVVLVSDGKQQMIYKHEAAESSCNRISDTKGDGENFRRLFVSENNHFPF